MTATEPAVAVPRAATSNTAPAGSEARAHVHALLRATRTRAPIDLLTEHLARLHGEHGFPVLRAAAEATVRRLRIAAEEGLRVRQRPDASPFGAYTTARKGQTGRPWATVLRGLAPLDGSCDCPDFRGNSLALCKHLLTVLADLVRRPRVFAKAAAQTPRPLRAPAVRWWPVKPLLGDGDWLQQVRLLGPAPSQPGGRWARLESALGSLPGAPRKRIALLDLLAAAADTKDDPALSAWITDERQRLQQATELAPLGRALSRHLRGFRRKLYPYQRTGVARFLDTGRLLLADDMGLGKTTQAIAACHVLWRQRLVARGLLLVPATLKSQWLREWQACCDLPIALVDGSPEERALLWRSRKRGFLLANYEQLLRDLDLVQMFAPDLVLLDEAQRIKNWATRTAATVKQLQPRFRLVLTGTPFENRLLELDSLLEWLDRRPLQPQWRLEPFHRLPADADGQGGGWRHLDVLRSRLAPVLLRRRRQEVLEQLPGRTDTRIDVPLTPPQREEHDARIQPIAVLLQTAERRPLTQQEFLRLMMLFTEQRIASNGIAQFAFDELWPGIHKARPEPALLDSLSMPKLLELRQLVQQLAVGQERKLVVFSQWRRALRLSAWACSDLFADADIAGAFFTGGEGSRKRDDSLVAFHDDPRVRVLFATDAGGVGL
ncbi:MAG TPA: DEAD/DEAH box helicase, partial [Planctomycetota bacterium]|nr:DEAD/DEAH box helicase [Planctomycetota bacterium]